MFTISPTCQASVCFGSVSLNGLPMQSQGRVTIGQQASHLLVPELRRNSSVVQRTGSEAAGFDAAGSAGERGGVGDCAECGGGGCGNESAGGGWELMEAPLTAS